MIKLLSLFLMAMLIACQPQSEPVQRDEPIDSVPQGTEVQETNAHSLIKNWPEVLQEKCAFLASHFHQTGLSSFDCQIIEGFYSDYGTKLNTESLYELTEEEKKRLSGNQNALGSFVFGTAKPINGFYPLILFSFGVAERPILLWLYDERGNFIQEVEVANYYGESGGCLYSERINDSTFLQHFSWETNIVDPEGVADDQVEMTFLEQQLMVHRDGSIREKELKRWMQTEQACNNSSLQQGDMIFHTSTSSQSQALQLATHSPYSHMGILFQEKGKWFVFEAVQPVKMTALDRWIKRGKDQHYVVKRHRDAEEILTDSVLGEMKQLGKAFAGKNYDLAFGWSDEQVYCSELVWKLYQRAAGIEIGRLANLKDFDLTSPLVNTKLQERYGENLPLEEIVISPAAMFNDSDLITVCAQ
ncbi:MAG: YiiX family permuted papain-like enzyme [Bacteroidota bacterium]